MKWLLLFTLLSVSAWAQCPGEDAEPAILLKTKAGPSLFVCGFEDRDVSVGKDKRAFSEFTIYSTLPDKPETVKVFTSEGGETYWLKQNPANGFEIQELWFFSDKPQPAFRMEVRCTATECVKTESKCILKMKQNPFPKALAEFHKRAAQGKLEEDGEDLIDQIFAQAFTGDKAAKDFYAKKPADLDSELEEAYLTNQKKLAAGCKR